MDIKYYYISFFKTNSFAGGWSVHSTLINIHPLDWNLENHYGYRYVVLSWQEVSKEVYDKHHDRLA